MDFALGKRNVDVVSFPMGVAGKLNDSPSPLQSYSESERCHVAGLSASPNSNYLVQELNCEDGGGAQLFDLNHLEKETYSLPSGHFLNWAPSGDWLLFRRVETKQILLIENADPKRQIDLGMPADTFDVTFTPDAKRITFVRNAGIKLGSEIRTFYVENGETIFSHQFPDHIVIYPRWSPDGESLVYILMPDNNVPFPIGELWLADPNSGQPLKLLAKVDSGHGFAPKWAPDGQSVAFVHRENPEFIWADQEPNALRSNIHTIRVTDGHIETITNFTDSLVYDINWSSDGKSMAFTADDGVWLVELGGVPAKVSHGANARHPVWLNLPMEN